MADIEIAGLILIISNIFISYKGLNDTAFFERYKFEIDPILIGKDYIRLISSGFLHGNWLHLIFNMVSLCAFSGLLENQIGAINFILIYFASLIGGDLLALYIHRNHGDYSSIGASGAVSGIIFASIALFPGLGIGFFGIPQTIPSWLYGILYVAYSIYGIKSKKDNIGHEAHLGGGLAGMTVAIIIQPSSLQDSYLPILCITVPSVIFLYMIVTKPHFLLIDNYSFKRGKSYINRDHKYSEKKADKQKDLDELLDKISHKGLNSLSVREKRKLEELSK